MLNLNPTPKVTEMIATLTGQKIKELEQTLSELAGKFDAMADDLGQQTAFKDDRTLIDGISQYLGAEQVEEYHAALEEMQDARDSREEALKALKVGAGVAVGATVTGLLWREANRRGWTARATQAIRTRQIVGFIQKRFGKTAAMAVKMTLAGKVTGVMYVNTGNGGKATYKPCKVTLPKFHLGLMTDDDQVIHFQDITRVELNRITNTDGTVEEAACLVVKINEAAE